jgi:hypothetical protein
MCQHDPGTVARLPACNRERGGWRHAELRDRILLPYTLPAPKCATFSAWFTSQSARPWPSIRRAAQPLSRALHSCGDLRGAAGCHGRRPRPCPPSGRVSRWPQPALLAQYSQARQVAAESIKAGPRPLPRRASTLRVMSASKRDSWPLRCAGSLIQVNHALGGIDLDQGAATRVTPKVHHHW